jgi:hypothetical protein
MSGRSAGASGPGRSAVKIISRRLAIQTKGSWNALLPWRPHACRACASIREIRKPPTPSVRTEKSAPPTPAPRGSAPRDHREPDRGAPSRRGGESIVAMLAGRDHRFDASATPPHTAQQRTGDRMSARTGAHTGAHRSNRRSRPSVHRAVCAQRSTPPPSASVPARRWMAARRGGHGCPSCPPGRMEEQGGTRMSARPDGGPAGWRSKGGHGCTSCPPDRMEEQAPGDSGHRVQARGPHSATAGAEAAAGRAPCIRCPSVFAPCQPQCHAAPVSDLTDSGRP